MSKERRMAQTPAIMWILDEARPSILAHIRMLLEREALSSKTTGPADGRGGRGRVAQ